MNPRTIDVTDLLERAKDDQSTQMGKTLLDVFTGCLNDYYPKGRIINEENVAEIIRAESGHELSNRYMASVAIEATFYKAEMPNLKVIARIDRANDDLGFNSRSWETVEEDEIVGGPEDTLDSLMEESRQLISGIHANMLRQLGIKEDVAADMAKSFWIA